MKIESGIIKNQSEKIENTPQKINKQLDNSSVSKTLETLESTKERISAIQKAVDSYAELINKGKYSTQEATALLTDKPLEDWPKTTRRLL